MNITDPTTRRVLDSATVQQLTSVALKFFVEEYEDFMIDEAQTVTALVVDHMDEGWELEPNSGEEVVEVVIFTEDYSVAMLINRNFNVIEDAMEENSYEDDRSEGTLYDNSEADADLETFDFGFSQTLLNAFGLCEQIDKANGDIYISDAVSQWEHEKGVDSEYITVTLSNGDGLVGYVSLLKEDGIEKSAYYRTHLEQQ